MAIDFYKYQGTGNDFILIDNRDLKFNKNDTKLVSQMCDRKFGIGADGLILLEPHATVQFTMTYYNADGNLSSMCGNGGRCITHFARFLGIIEREAKFEAVDGMHTATIEEDLVSLEMNDVSEISETETFAFLDTGSPHHVTEVENLSQYDVYNEGKKIREEVYGSEGANVNFVEALETDKFAVRTYERGVEDETLSCGTGVTAVAIAMHKSKRTLSEEIKLLTPGGELTVKFDADESGYKNVQLIGPAVQVFKGQWI
ncbi:MAG: diaminopimelate epimerase [Flavobacteriaceae bacterium]|nr:diaminopimelate epimerase [Flavobacteriaceae bacterium]